MSRIESPVRLSRGVRPSAWLALLKISVRQFTRGRRLLVLSALFGLPTLLALVVRYYNGGDPAEIARLEELIVFYMVPQALVPLTALVLATGMIRDEVEGQTLTYLLIRPLPRPSIYLAKLLAAWIVSAGLAAVFASTAVAAVNWGAEGFWGEVLPKRAAQVAGLSALSLMVYVSLFGLVGLVARWALPLGVIYTLLFEGAFANIDFSVRRLTVLWYVRVLAERWFGTHLDSWSIDLATAPSANEAILTLLGAALAMSLIGAFLFGGRESRVKTPEGG